MENRFIVPQFIDAENKIWGPITIRQFIIVMVGGLFIFLAYKLSDFSLFLLQAFLTVVLTIVFAFYKVNGAPFHLFALNFIETLKKPNVRVWRKEYIKIEVFKSKDEGAAAEEVLPRKKMVSSKKLSELSLIIDTGGAYKGEGDANKENNLRI
ncbi:MAG: PrgI family protein [Patescibacteria group bacterium]|nr:PrgI family protein [Patescibacteria group bacterium]